MMCASAHKSKLLQPELPPRRVGDSCRARSDDADSDEVMKDDGYCNLR